MPNQTSYRLCREDHNISKRPIPAGAHSEVLIYFFSRRRRSRGNINCEYNAWLHLDVISGGCVKRSKLFGQWKLGNDF